MKLLHLSDLHLGKRVMELSMLDEQRAMLEEALVLARQADVTILAGDIYDRQVPPAEAVALFDDFLSRMNRQGSPVVMIAGNHDSAERIAYGADLLGESGVYVAPVYDGQARCVTLYDPWGPVNIWLLPFIKPAHVRAALDAQDVQTYTQALRAAVEAMPLDVSQRNVLVAHQYVTGADRSESEEVVVGGLDNVDAEVFSAFDYVALGHLHSVQSLCGGRVRYSGAPLCYAFSEAGKQKGGLFVTLEEKGTLSVETAVMAPVHRMRSMRCTFAEAAREQQASEDYLQIILTDEDDIPQALGQLRALYPNLLQLRYDNARTRAQAADFTVQAAHSRAPQELFDELFLMQNGAQMTQEQRDYVNAMIESIWEDEV